MSAELGRLVIAEELDLQLCSGGSVTIPSNNPYQQSGEWVTQFSAVACTVLFRSWVKKKQCQVCRGPGTPRQVCMTIRSSRSGECSTTALV
ncbi:Alkaline proteinase [Fusarium oxysporum f. sp. albedinis]|nr:Alkaline proteinase [Fusarium oxysporum f. sp. albedinis]